MKLAQPVLACLLWVACSSFVGAAPASKKPSAVDPAKARWSIGALDGLSAYVQSQKTTGFLIIEDRKIIYEHNWPRYALKTGLVD